MLPVGSSRGRRVVDLANGQSQRVAASQKKENNLNNIELSPMLLDVQSAWDFHYSKHGMC